MGLLVKLSWKAVDYLGCLDLYSVYMAYMYKRHILMRTGTVYCSIPCSYIAIITGSMCYVIPLLCYLFLTYLTM